MINNERIINIEFLKENSSYKEDISWFAENINRDIDVKDLINILIKTKEAEKIRWCNWLITRIFTKTQCIKYAILAAEISSHLRENIYPDDTRPRYAINAAKYYLENTSNENKALARTSAAIDKDFGSAAHATYVAYASAASAAYAASVAACSAYADVDYADAAYTAADAASAAHAAYAAYSADYDVSAAYDVIYKKTMIKIINYGITLLGN